MVRSLGEIQDRELLEHRNGRDGNHRKRPIQETESPQQGIERKVLGDPRAFEVIIDSNYFSVSLDNHICSLDG